MEYSLFEKLEDAYGRSTQNCNYFKEALESVKWDKVFKADDEIYFVLGGFTFTAQSLDPFAQRWRPSAIFSDGSYISF